MRFWERLVRRGDPELEKKIHLFTERVFERMLYKFIILKNKIFCIPFNKKGYKILTVYMLYVKNNCF